MEMAPVLLLHGDFHQQKRDEVVAKFKRQECRVLVATDVAGKDVYPVSCNMPTFCSCVGWMRITVLKWFACVGRGLDIPSVRTVINYSPARDIDTHTHRIGRTGRAGMCIATCAARTHPPTVL
jgi:superfamily II DNA/RNA helicase